MRVYFRAKVRAVYSHTYRAKLKILKKMPGFLDEKVVYNGKLTNVFMRRPDGLFNTFAFPRHWCTEGEYTLRKDFRGYAQVASNQVQIDEQIRLRKLMRANLSRQHALQKSRTDVDGVDCGSKELMELKRRYNMLQSHAKVPAPLYCGVAVYVSKRRRPKKKAKRPKKKYKIDMEKLRAYNRSWLA